MPNEEQIIQDSEQEARDVAKMGFALANAVKLLSELVPRLDETERTAARVLMRRLLGVWDGHEALSKNQVYARCDMAAVTTYILNALATGLMACPEDGHRFAYERLRRVFADADSANDGSPPTTSEPKAPAPTTDTPSSKHEPPDADLRRIARINETAESVSALLLNLGRIEPLERRYFSARVGELLKRLGEKP